MKRFIVRAWIGGLILFCGAGLVRAQTTAELDLVNANYFNPAIVDNGVYAGPYSASTVTDNQLSPTFSIICDNYDTDVNTGLTWMAEGVTLSEEFATPPLVQPPLKLENSLSNYATTILLNDESGHTLPNTTNNVEQAYEAAASMAQQIMSIGSTNPNSLTSAQQQQIADYNWAIWAIFSNDATANSGGFDQAAMNDLTAALGTLYTLSEFNDVTFWIPYDTVLGPCTTASTDPPCPEYDASQEYMTITPGGSQGQPPLSPTPEPASMLLFGTGLLGIALIVRRKA